MLVWAWAVAAWAATVEVIPSAGDLHPGVPTQVLVAVIDDEGRASTEPPRVEVQDGQARFEGPAGTGVWSWTVVPPASGDEARFDVTALGQITTRIVHETPLPAPDLHVPRRLDALAGTGPVTFEVTGPDLPPPEALKVVTGLGTVTGVKAVGSALEVTLDPGDSPYPRFVPIGLLDARRDAPPVWTGLRLRTRPRIALQTEPGTTLSLTVGGRPYGPFHADDQGAVTGVVEQYPGEMVAQAVLTDDLGNETTTSLPLSSHTQPSLVALASGPLLPGQAPPVVWLHGYHGDGHSWEGSPPVCRTPSVGDLALKPTAPGAWRLALFELRATEAVDVRVQCTLGGAAESVLRVPVGEGIASRLRLRLWPDELSTDFPVAEVQAVLEDLRGERLPVAGLKVTADRGAVKMDPLDGLVARGEYEGQAAVEAGEDVVRATWSPPAGHGWVQRVAVGHGPVPLEGPLDVYGRALDVRRRPVAGVDLALSVGEKTAHATTGPNGWASATLPVPDQGLFVLAVRGRYHVARATTVPGAQAAGGPGTADLQADQVVRISAGRAADMVLAVDPPVLYTGGNAVARIEVSVLDRSGSPVTDAKVEVSATEGTVGPLHPTADGRYTAEYAPPPGDRRREVVITGHYESASATTQLLLEPRPVQRAAGLSFGAITNFGAVASPYLSVDVDWRLPWFDHSVMLRAGIGTYGDRSMVDTNLGTQARVSMVLVPLTIGLLGRRDLGGRALWLGLAGIIAPYHLDAKIGTDTAARGVALLPPGLSVIGGLGQRFGGGEVMLEIRASTLSSPGGALTYQGPVGGLAAVFGYRLVY